MRLSLPIIFLTFVLGPALTWAAPGQNTSPSTKGRAATFEDDDFDPSTDPTKTEPTQPSYPHGTIELPDTKLSPPTRLRRGPEDLNVHIGFQGGDVLETGDKTASNYVGLRYIPNSRPDNFWDFTLDAHDKNFLNTNVGYRWSFETDHFFRSYYRLAVSNYINAKDGLAGLINVRHVKLITALGTSDLFELQRRVCGEVGIGYGLSGAIMYIQIGYNYNF